MKTNNKILTTAGSLWELAALFDQLMDDYRAAAQQLEWDRGGDWSQAPDLLRNYQNKFNEILEKGFKLYEQQERIPYQD